jgi:hypothetical protein
MQLEGKYSHRI